MPLQQTSGAASYDAFGGGAPVAAKYIEDFFQTWLRTGTGASATVTTGLNASINKSLVWTKSRSAATNHKLTDTVRGATKALSSNTTSAEATDSQGLTAFSSTGYTIGTNTDYNNSGATYVDWQWLATPKFFDVVTYTGNGVTTGREIAHSLGSAVGALFVKNTSNPSDWPMWHNTFTSLQGMYLNTTQSKTSNTFESKFGNGTTVIAPTSTVFTVGIDNNVSGDTYVAYLFAHNAGGFGLTGTDNVISCGSFTTDASKNATVNLGYEPQFVLIKTTGVTGNWLMTDTMRGMPDTSGVYAATLSPNASTAENTAGQDSVVPLATGFKTNAATMQASQPYIYIAIRRGPMKVPTDGTKVFSPVTRTGTGSATTVSAGFPPDWALCQGTASTIGNQVQDRLRGPTLGLRTQDTAAETSSATDALTAFGQNGINVGANTTSSYWNYSGIAYINYFLRRAPGFFDEVCYAGTGSATTVAHNLGVAPELMIVKSRSLSATNWRVYSDAIGAGNVLFLNSTDASAASSATWNSTAPTASVFSVGTSNNVNGSGSTYVAYLFATCPGVSKVFSYTGNGTSQTINCGFTGGARFVLLKASSATGGWYVYDTARGMTVLTDPYLQLNSTAAETATLGSVTTVSTGFAVNEAITTGVNTSGVTYIGLAIS